MGGRNRRSLMIGWMGGEGQCPPAIRAWVYGIGKTWLLIWWGKIHKLGSANLAHRAERRTRLRKVTGSSPNTCTEPGLSQRPCACWADALPTEPWAPNQALTFQSENDSHWHQQGTHSLSESTKLSTCEVATPRENSIRACTLLEHCVKWIELWQRPRHNNHQNFPNAPVKRQKGFNVLWTHFWDFWEKCKNDKNRVSAPDPAPG